MAVRTENRDKGEVQIETGVGTIAKVEPKSRNSLIEIHVEGLRFPVKGWADHTDPAIAPFVAEGTKVAYEVTTSRDDGIDPAIPIADVDKMKKFRRVTGLVAAEDHHDAPSVPNEPTTGEVPRGPMGRQQTGTQADTWAFAAASGMVDLAAELVVSQYKEFDRKKVARVARTLLEAADKAQASVAPVDRSANSHTRARGAVRTAIEFFPIPWGAQPQEQTEWANRLAETAGHLLSIASELA